MASHFLLLGVPSLAALPLPLPFPVLPRLPHFPHFLISFPLSPPRLSLITTFCLYPTHCSFSPSAVLSFPLKPIFSYSLSLPFSFLLCDSFSLPSAPLRRPPPNTPLPPPTPLPAPGLSVPVFCWAVTCVCQPQALAGEVPRLPRFLPTFSLAFVVLSAGLGRRHYSAEASTKPPA